MLGPKAIPVSSQMDGAEAGDYEGSNRLCRLCLNDSEADRKIFRGAQETLGITYEEVTTLLGEHLSERGKRVLVHSRRGCV